jgi:cytochrome oxidase Cu insertion factor (SCO1/SenC/PrrC family)
MYKLTNTVTLSGQVIKTIQRLSDNAFIPFDSANTDFTKFKNEIQGIGENGESITPVELQDADGNTMTSEEVAEFITTLP